MAEAKKKKASTKTKKTKTKATKNRQSKARRRKNEGESEHKIRYAVVGLGHIAQVAVLPAFKHAENSELVALVSNDEEKLITLGKQYEVGDEGLLTYDDYPHALHDLDVDAVYIATPNHLHRDFAMDAMYEGFHVLCEKPLAISTAQCNQLIDMSQRSNVKLMTAYRLHFEESNLDAIEIACEKQELGELRMFNSVFSFQVKDLENIRLNPTSMGGGPLWDIGTYCINAARGLFRDEPLEVMAFAENNGEERFCDVDEMISVMMRFPNNRLANFIISFGADSCSNFDIIGTKGRLHLENAYEYTTSRELSVYNDEEKKHDKKYKKVDQFGPELVYFSDCILNDEDPEPDLYEGRADVRVIEAILESLDIHQAISLEGRRDQHMRYPDPDQFIQRPAISKPKTIHVSSPSGS